MASQLLNTLKEKIFNRKKLLHELKMVLTVRTITHGKSYEVPKIDDIYIALLTIDLNSRLM